MSTTTPNNWKTDRRQTIDDEIAKPNSRVTYQEGTKTQEKSFFVELINDTQEVALPEYLIDIDTVSYNFENVRIKKYKKARCKTLGVAKLDQEKEAHQKVVQDILLNTKSYSVTKATDLRENMAKKRQTNPALITPEGILLNGNKRVAVMRDFWENGFESSLANGVNIQARDGEW